MPRPEPSQRTDTRFKQEERSSEVRTVVRRKEPSAALFAYHDARSALSAVLANVEYIRGAIADGKTVDTTALDDIDESAKHVNALLNEALAGARSQKRIAVRAKVGLAPIVASAVRRFSQRAIGKGVTIMTVAEESGEANIDAALVGRVLSNLIENAFRFAPPGTTIDIRHTVRAGVAIFRVLDRGPGIPEDAIARVFEPFYTTDEGPHSGLGLAFGRDVAAAHRGSIRAKTATAAAHASSSSCPPNES